jgi:threonine synthase
MLDKNMNEYIYKCFDCNKIYSKEEVENNLLYLCPTCGVVEKNKPLRGILLVEYDYESLKKKHTRKNFFKLQPGRFWEYDFLWPLEFSNGRVFRIDPKLLDKISLETNCFQELFFEGNSFQLIDDTRNPTLSYKDRASSLVALKAMQLGINFISAASTGNAGSSLAGICARLGLKSSIFVPKNIPEAKRIQIQSFGAELVIVDGDYDNAFDACLEISSARKWYNRNTGYNPLTIEGKKSTAYDIFSSTKGNIPEVIFIPTGDGVILSGLYKGFWELKQLGWIEILPKLIAVQAEGANAFYRYWENQSLDYLPAESIADSICAGSPRALYYGIEALQKTNGEVICVSDEEIINAQKYVTQNYGILLEPSSSSGFAAYKKYISNNSNEKALLLFTGNGLKDVSALKTWNKNIDTLNMEKLRERFLK